MRLRLGGRPKQAGSKRSSSEAYRRYMREYMRRYRNGEGNGEVERGRHAEDAAFDPLRDGYPQHCDLTAALMGDPPVGRSALDGQPINREAA